MTVLVKNFGFCMCLIKAALKSVKKEKQDSVISITLINEMLMQTKKKSQNIFCFFKNLIH